MIVTKMKYLIKLLLPALLLLCLVNMPYGYYVFIRIIMSIAAAIISYNYFEQNKNEIAYFWGGIVILFQPLYKIPLGKDLWKIVDLIIAIILIIRIYKDYNKSKREI